MFRFKYEDLFNVWLEKKDINEKKSNVFEHVIQIVGSDETVVISNDIQKKICRLCNSFEQKWSDCQRTICRFKSKNSDWLKREITFTDDAIPSASSS